MDQKVSGRGLLMQKKSGYLIALFNLIGLLLLNSFSWAAEKAPAGSLQDKVSSLWDLIAAGGSCMIVQALLSMAALAIVIHHWRYVSLEKLVPRDFCENLYALLEKKEYEKAVSVCKQQENIVSLTTLAVLTRFRKNKPTGLAQIESIVQVEGKPQIEKLWQNLTYLGDIAIVAPLVGLLGTVLGMINAFHYFKAGSIHPGVLTQGLAKAMVNTVAGLIVAVVCLGFYSYFRGRISAITTRAEAAASEIAQILSR